MLEAVFRYQFTHNAAGSQGRHDYIFIEYPKDQSPPAALLARFAGHAPPVLPVSEAALGVEGSVRRRGEGGQGLIFRVEQIRWLDDQTAEVEGGYYEASLSASGNTYRVEIQNDRWVVVKDTMHWIS